jgi:hypothetical protein
LNGRWGELDVRDVVAAAKAIANHGLGDSRKLIVSGGSAGGFIVLASLAFYPDVFAAGLNSFGVSDLRALAADSHKFESRYTDTLVGPLPQAANIYAERSPINAIDRIRAPLLICKAPRTRSFRPRSLKRLPRRYDAAVSPWPICFSRAKAMAFVVKRLSNMQSKRTCRLSAQSSDSLPPMPFQS